MSKDEAEELQIIRRLSAFAPELWSYAGPREPIESLEARFEQEKERGAFDFIPDDLVASLAPTVFFKGRPFAEQAFDVQRQTAFIWARRRGACELLVEEIDKAQTLQDLRDLLGSALDEIAAWKYAPYIVAFELVCDLLVSMGRTYMSNASHIPPHVPSLNV